MSEVHLYVGGPVADLGHRVTQLIFGAIQLYDPGRAAGGVVDGGAVGYQAELGHGSLLERGQGCERKACTKPRAGSALRL